MGPLSSVMRHKLTTLCPSKVKNSIEVDLGVLIVVHMKPPWCFIERKSLDKTLSLLVGLDATDVDPFGNVVIEPDDYCVISMEMCYLMWTCGL